MPPITVDPQSLSGAGDTIGSVGDQIASAVGTLTSSLSGGARSGIDPAGLVFGHSYQQTAQALLDASAAAVNAGRSVGFGVQMSATNYSRADAASTVGGGASALPPPEKPVEFGAPSAPSSLGGGVQPPMLWSVIQTFIPDVWPDGDPAALRSTSNAWQSFSSTMNGIIGQLAGPSGTVAAQQIPEGGAMTTAISELQQNLSAIVSESEKVATQAREFADDVENTQNAIRDLVDRVSPSGLWDGIKAVFDGDALEEVKAIADDVKAVLEGYGHQAEARRDMLQIGMGMLDEAIVSVEKWARREFPKYLGDDVGNALATGLDFQLTLGEGILAGGVDLAETAGQFDPLRFAYDPEGAKDAYLGMAESLGTSLMYATPAGVMANPAGAFEHYKNQVTDAVHAEDWSSDRPGFGPGKILFDVGLSAIPGGAAARGTKAAVDAGIDGAPSPGRMVDSPSGPDSLASATQRIDDVTENLNDVATSFVSATGSGPAVPESLIDPPKSPDAPRVPDAPTTPGSAVPLALDSSPADRSPSSAPEPGDTSGPQSSAPSDRSHDNRSSPTTDSPTQVPASASGEYPQSEHPPTQVGPSANASAGPLPNSDASAHHGAPPMRQESAPTFDSAPTSVAPNSIAGDTSGPASSSAPSAEPSASPSTGSLDSRSVELGSAPDRNDTNSASGTSGSSPEYRDSSTTDRPYGSHSGADGPEHDGDVEPKVQGTSVDGSHSDTNGVPISGEAFNEILETEKGHRPDPDLYLPPEYIAEHLKSFEDGASRIILRDSFEEYGIGKPDAGKTEFVLTSDSAREIMTEANGDPMRIAQRLGIPEDQLANDSLVLVEFHPTDAYKPLMPSGNEWGANPQWLPGGKLPHGDLEAVVMTEGMVNGVDYTVTDIVTGEVL